MTHEEQLSAYLDGQLSERERAAFELHLRADAVLQRSLDVTRFAIHAAQQLPAATLPRSFVLPTSMATPERARFDWRLALRIGSAIAAALFVVLIGLDLSALLPRPTFQPAPVIAPSPQLILPATLATQPNAEIVIVPSVAGTQLATQFASLPPAPRRPQVAANDSGAEVPVTAPQARATKSLNTLSKLTPTMVATAIPTAITLALTPVPTLASGLPMDANPTWVTGARLLAGFMLTLSAAFAFLGWRKSG